MAALYGVNATKRDVNSPSEKIDVSQDGARVRFLYDEITLAAELSVSDTIDLMKIKKGMRLLDFEVSAPADAASGQLKIGWTAGANGDEDADDDGIMAAAEFDVGSALSRLKMLKSAAGFLKKFDDDVTVQGVCAEVTTDSTGNKWQFSALVCAD